MHLTPQEKRNSNLQRIFLGLLGVVFTFFIGTKIYPLVHGPDIQVATITNGAKITTPMIQLSGVARFTKDLVVNGAPLATAPDGSFDENILLNPGYNVVTMEGRDRFGNRHVDNYTLILTEKTNPVLTLDTPPLTTN